MGHIVNYDSVFVLFFDLFVANKNILLILIIIEVDDSFSFHVIICKNIISWGWDKIHVVLVNVLILNLPIFVIIIMLEHKLVFINILEFLSICSLNKSWATIFGCLYPLVNSSIIQKHDNKLFIDIIFFFDRWSSTKHVNQSHILNFFSFWFFLV